MDDREDRPVLTYRTPETREVSARKVVVPFSLGLFCSLVLLFPMGLSPFGFGISTFVDLPLAGVWMLTMILLSFRGEKNFWCVVGLFTGGIFLVTGWAVFG